MNKKEQKIDEFIRDITSVIPFSKSEAKRRLDEIIFQERERIIKMIEKQIEPVKGKHTGKSWCPQCEDQGYQYALDDIINKIKEN